MQPHKVDECWHGAEPGIKGPAWRKVEEVLPARAAPGTGALVSLPHNCADCSALGYWRDSIECWSSPQWFRHRIRVQMCRRAGESWLVRIDGGPFEASPVACHSRWHDGCRGSRAQEQIQRLIELQAGLPGGQLYILTLTVQKRGTRRYRDWAWLHLWSRWAHFRSRLRHAGVELGQYVAVVEAHTSGWPHLHVITLCPPPGRRGRSVARLAWMKLGGGSIFQWARIKKNPFYVCKYLGKSKGFPETLKALLTVHQVRLTNASPGLLPKKPETPKRWRRVTRATLHEMGSRVDKTGPDGISLS